MSQSKKNNKGFTLVEVIVVAVIVAILAAVAIPIYQQYVTDSSNNSAQNAGGSIASFCGACASSKGVITDATDSIACDNKTSIRKPNNVTITLTQGTTRTVAAKGSKGDSTYTYHY